MRILVVSNLFPPLHVGGYEIACAQAVDGLRRRGHEMAVLTSTYGLDRPARDGDVFRVLSLRSFDWYRQTRAWRALRIPLIELSNRRVFRRAVEQLAPDVVQFWNMRQISLSAIRHAQRMGLPTAFYIHDSWLAQLRLIDPWDRITTRSEPSFRHVQFASRYLKERALEAGRDVADAEVVHWGVDTSAFAFRAEPRAVRRLLYIGQVEAHKGVDVAIEALARAAPHLSLTVVGGSVDPAYHDRLRRLAGERGLAGRLDFRGAVPHESLPAVYRGHDVLVFPSRSEEEGLPLTLLEAMASGTTVIAAPASGAREVLRDGENALTFPVGDAEACGARINALVRDAGLAERLRAKARRLVEERFELASTIDGIARGLEAARRG